jgi:hypothetical protein
MWRPYFTLVAIASQDACDNRRVTDGEFRDWMREWTLRFDKRHAQVMRAFDRADRKLDEVIAENRAQRQALFAILDRMNNGGAPA